MYFHFSCVSPPGGQIAGSNGKRMFHYVTVFKGGCAVLQFNGQGLRLPVALPPRYLWPVIFTPVPEGIPGTLSWRPLHFPDEG